jgi:hypothetical protein
MALHTVYAETHLRTRWVRGEYDAYQGHVVSVSFVALADATDG